MTCVHKFYNSLQEYEQTLSEDKDKTFISFDDDPEYSPMRADLLGEIYGWDKEEFAKFIKSVQNREPYTFKPNAQGNCFGRVSFQQSPAEGVEIGYFIRMQKQEAVLKSEFYLEIYFMEGVYHKYVSVIVIKNVDELVTRLHETETKVDNEFDRIKQQFGVEAPVYCENIRNKYMKEYFEKKKRQKEEFETYLKQNKDKKPNALTSLLMCGSQDLLY